MTLDYELKIRRAFHHLMELDKVVKPWVNGERHTTRCEVDANETTRFYFATAEQPDKDPLSVIIGDVLHNLRSGLDNLAFALATAFTAPLPDDIAGSSEFPIVGDSDKTRATGVGHGQFHKVHRKGGKAGSPTPDSGLWKVRGWHPQAQAIVEGLQPYKRGNAFRTHPLWVLHDLNRVDKHRLLHVGVAGWTGAAPLFFNPGDINLAGTRAVGGGGSIQTFGGPIETDTPVATIVNLELIPLDPDRDVYMDVPIAVHVAFADGTPCVEHEPVYKTLLDIYTYINVSVLPPLRPFL